MKIRIRRANLTDAVAIAQILRALGWFAHLNSEPENVTLVRIAHFLDLCQAEGGHSVYVAENAKSEVVGYGAVHFMPTLFLTGPEGYVSELFVAEGARGQGIGSQLLSAMKEEAKERGCARLLVLNRRLRESYARGFYQKCGWEERPDAANFVLKLV